MKKIYLLFLLLIPVSVRAETVYTNYQEHLLNQTIKINTNDLIREEEIKYYHYTNKRINEGYYELNLNPSSAPYYDPEDKIIVGKRERYSLQSNAIRGTLYSITDDFEVNFFEIKGINDIPNLTIYDIDYNALNYEIINKKVILAAPISLSNMILLFDFEGQTNFNILVNGALYFDVVFNDTLFTLCELNFIIAPLFNDRLRIMGVYTSAHYDFFNYYIYYTYNYKYYDLTGEDIVKTIPETGYDFITSEYNYYIRDKIVFKDYLILSNENQNLNEYIIESSAPDKIMIKSDIDFQKNGIYLVEYQYQDLTILKYIFVLNEPIKCDEQIEDIKEPIIEIKEKIVYRDIVVPSAMKCPEVICSPQIKEIEKIKYEYIPKIVDCPNKTLITSSSNKKISKDFNLAYAVPIAPIILIIILFNRKKHKLNKY